MKNRQCLSIHTNAYLYFLRFSEKYKLSLVLLAHHQEMSNGRSATDRHLTYTKTIPSPTSPSKHNV